jgi:hypothetical protein
MTKFGKRNGPYPCRKIPPLLFLRRFCPGNAGSLDGSHNKPESAFCKITRKWCITKHAVGNSRGTSGITTT